MNTQAGGQTVKGSSPIDDSSHSHIVPGMRLVGRQTSFNRVESVMTTDAPPHSEIHQGLPVKSRCLVEYQRDTAELQLAEECHSHHNRDASNLQHEARRQIVEQSRCLSEQAGMETGKLGQPMEDSNQDQIAPNSLPKQQNEVCARQLVRMCLVHQEAVKACLSDTGSVSELLEADENILHHHSENCLETTNCVQLE